MHLRQLLAQLQEPASLLAIQQRGQRPGLQLDNLLRQNGLQVVQVRWLALHRDSPLPAPMQAAKEAVTVLVLVLCVQPHAVDLLTLCCQLPASATAAATAAYTATAVE